MRPYRTVRHVSSGTDAPWPGTLVRLDSGESRVLVDAAALPSDWDAWGTASDGHLLAPLDIVRRPDGHAVAFPVCTRRLADFLEQRRAGRVPLTPGEAVTLAVSVVRGLADLDRDRTTTTTGEWWLTEAGRPVLALGVGNESVKDASLGLIDEVSAGQADPRLWGDVRTSVAHGEGSRGLAHVEARLFAWSAASPLADAPLASARSARLEPMALDRVRRADLPPLVTEHRRGGLVDRLVGHVDGDLADLVSRSTTGIWRRLRRREPAGRRRPWLVAGGVAVAVVAIGALWPTASVDPVAADTPSPTASSVSAPVSTPAVEPPPSPSADLAAVTSDLLAARTSCAGAVECLADYVVDPRAQYAPGIIDIRPEERSVTLVDDFGGVAVLRVTSADEADGDQLVVIQRQEGRWLLRDVYAAQEP